MKLPSTTTSGVALDIRTRNAHSDCVKVYDARWPTFTHIGHHKPVLLVQVSELRVSCIIAWLTIRLCRKG